MKTRRWMAVLLAACMTASLAGCGGSAASSGGAGTGAADTKAAGDSKAAGDTAAASEAGKDSVVVACAAEPDCFFPVHSKNGTNMDEVPILHNIYETPIKLGADGSHEPLLAESWEISEDGTEYTLHMRDDVYFQDGNKMTMEDVAFSLDLAGNSTAGKAQLANYEKTEVIDEKTVKIHLKSPYGPFLNALCGRYALIFEKAYYESAGEDKYNDAPIGTGPYKFVSRSSGDKIVLEANENYWGGVPEIKDVTFKIIADTNTQMVSLENGDIDVLIQANVGSLSKLQSDKVKWDKTDASSICNMGLNCTKGPASDLNFRKALQYGINKDEVNIGVYEGYATTGDIAICPSFSGRPDADTYTVVDYDLDKAKEYLAASNYKGEEFKIVTVSGTKNESAAQVVQGQLIGLGINCTVNAVDAASYNALTAQTGDFDASIRAGGVSVLDADGLYFMYYSKQITGEGKYDAGVSSPELDKWIDEGRVETDEAVRKQDYANACNIITDNAYSVTLYYELNAVAYSTSLKGVVPRSLTGLYFFNDWTWQ